MEIEPDEFSAALWGPAAILFYGTAFQLGYFDAIGIEFLSLVGVADWIFAFAYVLPAGLITIPIMITLSRHVSRRIDDGTWHTSDWLRVSVFLDTWKGLALIFVIAIVFAMLNGEIPNLWLVYYPAVVVLAITMAVEIATSVRDFRPISVSSLAMFALVSGMLVFNSTSHYVSAYGGRVCNFHLDDNTIFQSKFLRHVREGYLVRLEQTTELISSSSVRRVVCATGSLKQMVSIQEKKYKKPNLVRPSPHL